MRVGDPEQPICARDELLVCSASNDASAFMDDVMGSTVLQNFSRGSRSA